MEGQTRIEFNSDGSFVNSSLKINDAEIYDCTEFAVEIGPMGLVRTRIVLEGSEVRFNGQLLLEGDDGPLESLRREMQDELDKAKQENAMLHRLLAKPVA